VKLAQRLAFKTGQDDAGQQGLRPPPVRRLVDGLDAAPGDVEAAALIPGEVAHAPGQRLLPVRIAPVSHRACPGDDDHADHLRDGPGQCDDGVAPEHQPGGAVDAPGRLQAAAAGQPQVGARQLVSHARCRHHPFVAFAQGAVLALQAARLVDVIARAAEGGGQDFAVLVDQHRERGRLAAVHAEEVAGVPLTLSIHHFARGIASTKRRVISCGSVMARPTTTANAPRSKAARTSAGVL